MAAASKKLLGIFEKYRCASLSNEELFAFKDKFY